ncbi:rhodanese-like domain-containing protein [uncultured Aquimarina sp.]|uniref:rhodanese-like domain-containing protein n=1 Tax=uncultured Aquimarina sp. TaxID=575652 RepID=UPI00260BDE8A|nr:rhodanese-like domain-containing protein [uncultured Aquimarina sp.]
MNLKASFILILTTVLLASCNQEIKPTALTVNAFKDSIQLAKNTLIIDVRTPQETLEGYLPSSLNINFKNESFLDSAFAKADKNKSLFLYCGSGRRSKLAATRLVENGYENVHYLNDSISSLVKNGMLLTTKTKEKWEKWYSNTEYIYGKEVNQFFKSVIDSIPPEGGAALFPAEGEGRNAVYTTRLGWKVDAFDLSTEGKRKAELLAEEAEVALNYKIADYGKPELVNTTYNVIALIYSHVPNDVRVKGNEALVASLKPGGFVVLEMFSECHKNSGSTFGPKSDDFLVSIEELRSEFKNLSILLIEEKEIELSEGYHQGKGVVVRMIAQKK